MKGGAQEKGSSSASSHEDLNKEYHDHHETPAEQATTHEEHEEVVGTICCPNCSHKFEPTPEMLVDFFKRFVSKFGGVKFEPSDEQLINHLEAKVNRFGDKKANPLMDEFIATIEGDKDICYTVPDRLPGVTKDGTSKHFLHKSSKAYKTGSRKRRKIESSDEQVHHEVSETRWHKTGKTKQIMSNGVPRGCKKILVLYTNFGKSRKPAKTNWIMHQYHLGGLEDHENDGELVVSKIFYQTHPRQPSAQGRNQFDGPYQFFRSANTSEVPSEQSLEREGREPMMSYMEMAVPYLNIHGSSLAPQVLSMPALNLNPPKLLPQDSNFPALINLNEPSVLYSPLVIAPPNPMHQPSSAILPNHYQENMAATSTYQQQQYHGDATTSLEEMMTSCAAADPKEGTSNNAPSNSNVDWGFLNWQTNHTTN